MSEDMNKPTSDTATISDTVNLPSTETTAQNTTTKTNDGSMSIIAHLTELRKRLIRSLIAIGVGSCIAYYFIEDIMHLLTASSSSPPVGAE